MDAWQRIAGWRRFWTCSSGDLATFISKRGRLSRNSLPWVGLYLIPLGSSLTANTPSPLPIRWLVSQDSWLATSPSAMMPTNSRRNLLLWKVVDCRVPDDRLPPVLAFKLERNKSKQHGGRQIASDTGSARGCTLQQEGLPPLWACGSWDTVDGYYWDRSDGGRHRRRFGVAR